MPSSPTPSEQPPIDIRTPGLVEALSSVQTHCIWERLRTIGQPTTVAALAASGDWQRDEVQRALDALASVQLVASAPATRATGAVTWSVTRQSLAISFRGADATDQALRAKLFGALERERTREVRAKIMPESDRKHGEVFWWNSRDALFLNREQLRELWGIMSELSRFFARCANENAGPDAQSRSQDCNYNISVDIEPMHPGVRPMPQMILLESKHAEAFSSTVMETPLADLSKRELEVARQLAAGSSSKQVAEKLGLSPNTVAEFTRRVYKKLGAKNRAELVLKMRGTR
jgi:hypothetical protein